jgi:plasmid stabilization system protein ParE
MRVRYAPEARAHLAAIFAYVAEQNPIAAVRVIGRIRAAADRLGDFPRMGHTGRVPGTFEWAVTGLPYVIVHEVDVSNAEVVILSVFHAAQDRPTEASR